MAVKMSILFFLVVTPCRLGVTIQKNNIHILITLFLAIRSVFIAAL
jgi:hypothetical protein